MQELSIPSVRAAWRAVGLENMLNFGDESDFNGDESADGYFLENPPKIKILLTIFFVHLLAVQLTARFTNLVGDGSDEENPCDTFHKDIFFTPQSKIIEYFKQDYMIFTTFFYDDIGTTPETIAKRKKLWKGYLVSFTSLLNPNTAAAISIY